MKRLALTVLISMSMLLTTGYQTQGENINLDSLALDVIPRGYEVIEFSKQDAFEQYIKLAPESVQLYFYTKKYCKEYGVPEEIAFAVAGLETGYRGPDKFHYNQRQISTANAYGSYQLLLSTARDMYELLGLGDRYELTSEMLLSDVKLNTMLGIRYLKWLHDNISKNWIVACGFYNTGYELINQYARDAVRVYNSKRDV